MRRRRLGESIRRAYRAVRMREARELRARMDRDVVSGCTGGWWALNSGERCDVLRS